MIRSDDFNKKNANEVITFKSVAQGPRIKEQMQDVAIIPYGSVLIENDRIVAIGPFTQLEVDYPDLLTVAEVIDATGKVVMPGLVDCHTHLVHGGTREQEFNMRLNGSTYMDIMNAGGGIHATTKQTREASFDELYGKTLRHLDVFLKHGITTVEAKSGYGLDWENERKQLEVAKKLHATHAIDIVSTFMGAHAVPRDYKGREDEFVDILVDDMLPKVAELGLAEFNDVFCEKGVFTPEQSRRILEAGKALQLTPKIHADEIEPYKGAELAAEVGAISAEHLLVASDEGIQKNGSNRYNCCIAPWNRIFLARSFRKRASDDR